MKNKKILIILGIFIVLSGYFLFLYSFNEPHFKIIKKECWNETHIKYVLNWEIYTKIDALNYYYNSIGCDYIKKLNLSEPALCVAYENLIKELQDSIQPLENVTEEICEQIEVDELIVCCLRGKSEKIYENISGLIDKASFTNMESDYYNVWCLPKENLEYFEVPCEIIKKEDLTIEWLDWNAECTKINKPCEDLECNNGGKCVEYKFGNYIIETWGQTK